MDMPQDACCRPCLLRQPFSNIYAPVSPSDLKALEAVQRILSPTELSQLIGEGYLDVEARSGRVYRIIHRRSPVVTLTRRRRYLAWLPLKAARRYCINAVVAMPSLDILLAFYLLIKTNEWKFRRTARRMW